MLCTLKKRVETAPRLTNPELDRALIGPHCRVDLAHSVGLEIVAMAFIRIEEHLATRLRWHGLFGLAHFLRQLDAILASPFGR
jgi:hypothetical protein